MEGFSTSFAWVTGRKNWWKKRMKAQSLNARFVMALCHSTLESSQMLNPDPDTSNLSKTSQNPIWKFMAMAESKWVLERWGLAKEISTGWCSTIVQKLLMMFTPPFSLSMGVTKCLLKTTPKNMAPGSRNKIWPSAFLKAQRRVHIWFRQ